MTRFSAMLDEYIELREEEKDPKDYLPLTVQWERRERMAALRKEMDELISEPPEKARGE